MLLRVKVVTVDFKKCYVTISCHGILLVQLRKEDELADVSSQRNNACEEQPLSQCWAPGNIDALSDIGFNDYISY